MLHKERKHLAKGTYTFTNEEKIISCWCKQFSSVDIKIYIGCLVMILFGSKSNCL